MRFDTATGSQCLGLLSNRVYDISIMLLTFFFVPHLCVVEMSSNGLTKIAAFMLLIFAGKFLISIHGAGSLLLHVMMSMETNVSYNLGTLILRF